MHKLASYDPSNGELLGEVEITTTAQIGAIVDNAQAAGKEWQKRAITERVESLEKAYAQLEPHLDELSVLLSREMGKDIRRAGGEVGGPDDVSGPGHDERRL